MQRWPSGTIAPKEVGQGGRRTGLGVHWVTRESAGRIRAGRKESAQVLGAYWARKEMESAQVAKGNGAGQKDSAQVRLPLHGGIKPGRGPTIAGKGKQLGRGPALPHQGQRPYWGIRQGRGLTTLVWGRQPDVGPPTTIAPRATTRL